VCVCVSVNVSVCVKCEPYGITGVEVMHVTKIQNKFLRNRFEEKLEVCVCVCVCV